MTNRTKDMKEYISPSVILSEARMMKKDYDETYILVEGESDERFFRTLYSTERAVRFRSSGGYERVINTILLAQKEEYNEILGIIDGDYHRLLQDGIVESAQLIFTDSNDIEMMLFFSQSFEKFLSVCASQNKLEPSEDYRKPILKSASVLGALRVVSLQSNLNLWFDGFECKDFVNRTDLISDDKQLINKIAQRTRSHGISVTMPEETILTLIKLLLSEHSESCLCNGHDVLDILGIAMSKLYASAASTQYSPEALFDYLLMGYSIEEFQSTSLFQKLNDWINANTHMA